MEQTDQPAYSGCGPCRVPHLSDWLCRLPSHFCNRFVQDTLGRFAIRWLLHSLMWGLGGSMDAKGRAELGEVLIHHSGLAPPVDGADLTSLQV